MADGAAIVGATSTTLKPALAQVGKAITVQVMASYQLGYASTAALSATTAAVQPGVLSQHRRRRRSPVTHASAPPWTASPGVVDPGAGRLGYQWRADGAVIAGATDSTLTVGPRAVGKALSVTVDRHEEGLPEGVPARRRPPSPSSPARSSSPRHRR